METKMQSERLSVARLRCYGMKGAFPSPVITSGPQGRTPGQDRTNPHIVPLSSRTDRTPPYRGVRAVRHPVLAPPLCLTSWRAETFDRYRSAESLWRESWPQAPAYVFPRARLNAANLASVANLRISRTVILRPAECRADRRGAIPAFNNVNCKFEGPVEPCN